MMILRWLYFAAGIIGCVFITSQVWIRAGWMLGLFMALMCFVSAVEALERTLMKQWKMKKVVTWEEVDE